MSADKEMVTIRLPKEMCELLHNLADYAAGSEDARAGYIVANVFFFAARKGEINLDDPTLLNIYKPYDEGTEQGGWDSETLHKLDDALLEVLKR